MRKILSAICLYAIVLTNVMIFGVLSPPRTVAQTVQENLSEPNKNKSEDDSISSSVEKNKDDDDGNQNNGGGNRPPTPTPTPQLPCVPGTFTFSGSTATDGSDGNTRTFTQNGVTARVNAFSINQNNFNFDEAYLGLYPNGLGVTDKNEGNGQRARERFRLAQPARAPAQRVTGDF